MTPDRPDLLYGEGLTIERSEWASDVLLDDLRSDEAMEWIPEQAWFTYLKLETEAVNVVYDLSVGVGATTPSFVDAGFMTIEPTPDHLEAVGLQWILDAGETPELALTAEQIEALQFELTTEQIEALGFERATPWWRDAVTAALVVAIAGAVGGALVMAAGRSKTPEVEAEAEEQERVSSAV